MGGGLVPDLSGYTHEYNGTSQELAVGRAIKEEPELQVCNWYNNICDPFWENQAKRENKKN